MHLFQAQSLLQLGACSQAGTAQQVVLAQTRLRCIFPTSKIRHGSQPGGPRQFVLVPQPVSSLAVKNKVSLAFEPLSMQISSRDL